MAKARVSEIVVFSRVRGARPRLLTLFFAGVPSPFTRDHIAADDLRPAFKMLARVARAQGQLIQSWDVLSTMTPHDYSQLRPHLGGSSGFQSAQYRMMEFMLGGRNPDHVTRHEATPEIAAVLHLDHDRDALRHHGEGRAGRHQRRRGRHLDAVAEGVADDDGALDEIVRDGARQMLATALRAVDSSVTPLALALRPNAMTASGLSAVTRGA